MQFSVGLVIMENAQILGASNITANMANEWRQRMGHIFRGQIVFEA